MNAQSDRQTNALSATGVHGLAVSIARSYKLEFNLDRFAIN